MNYLFILLFVPISVLGQELKILSSKDRTPVPFAFLTLKSANYFSQQISDVNGVILLDNKKIIVDSASYRIEIKSIGFLFYSEKIKGDALKRLTTIFLKVDSVSLDEVVITAQYEPTIADASIPKIKIIDKKKIQQMGAVNLRDVLTNQLNVRLQQDNILGNSMNLQGVSGENVKILIDGVPMIGRLNGNIDLSQINLYNVERIEIIEGPLSVQYGTNALAGTINIITKKSKYQTQSVGITAYYESIGAYNLTGDVTLSKNKHSLQLSGGRNYFDGWNPNDKQFYFPKPHIADSTRFKQWKAKEQYFGSSGYQYQFKNATIGFKSDYFNEKISNKGYPRAPYAETSFDDYYYTQRIDNSIQLDAKLSKKWTVKSTSSYNYYSREKKTYYKDLTTLNEQLSANSSDQDTSQFSLIMTRASFVHKKDSTKLNYEFGYDVNYESALGKRIESKTQAMGDYALLTTAEYKPFTKLILKMGLRYAYNTNYKSPLVPSLNLKWEMAPKHKLRVSYAKGFRAPTIKELYFYFVDINHNILGNENLKAENSNNYALSYNYSTLLYKLNYKFDLSMFYNDIYNLISLAQLKNTEYAYINIGKYKTMGIQFGNTINYKELTTLIGFNYTGRYNQLSENKNIPKFNYSPELQCNLSYHFKNQNASIALFYKYNGKLPSYSLINDEVVQGIVNHYQIMDASLSKLFLKEKLAVSVGCKNIFAIHNISTNISGGVHSSSASSIALATGRNYFIKLSININHLQDAKNK